jgi:group I intron endonuclease
LLEILEYCEKKKTILMDREQYYMDLLQPEYNILQKAGSSQGFKHNSLTLAKFKNRGLSEENLKRLAKINSDPEILAKRLETLKDINSNPELQAKKIERLKAYTATEEVKERLRDYNLLRRIPVEVTDTETGNKTIYESMTEAGKALGVKKQSISQYLESKRMKPYKNRFLIRKINGGNNYSTYSRSSSKVGGGP